MLQAPAASGSDHPASRWALGLRMWCLPACAHQAMAAAPHSQVSRRPVRISPHVRSTRWCCALPVRRGPWQGSACLPCLMLLHQACCRVRLPGWRYLQGSPGRCTAAAACWWAPETPSLGLAAWVAGWAARPAGGPCRRGRVGTPLHRPACEGSTLVRPRAELLTGPVGWAHAEVPRRAVRTGPRLLMPRGRLPRLPRALPSSPLPADDYQQPGPGQVHPDMAQPGPGRGADWDRMFG